MAFFITAVSLMLLSWPLDAGASPAQLIPTGATQDSCVVEITGDVNTDGRISPSDIIYLVNYVFLRGGPPPQPCLASGDVNCNGSIRSDDIIYLVNYCFKNGPAPCDVCTMIPGYYTCP